MYVGGVYPERIPALGSPGLAHATAFKYSVARAALRKNPADLILVLRAIWLDAR